MKTIEKINKILYILIFTAFTTLIFVINITSPEMGFYKNDSMAYQFVMSLCLSIKEFDIIYVTIGIFIYYAYYNIYFDGTKISKKTFINSIISILLTFTIIIGKSYKIDNTLGIIFNTPAQIFKSILLSIGYYFMFYALLKKVTSIKILPKTTKTNLSQNKKKNPIIEKIIKIIDKYQIIIMILIILLGWIPYIIFYFPGASTGDTFDSLSQFFHQNNSWSIKTINLLSKDVYINKHHPPLFTVTIGLVFKLGKLIDSFTLGAFIYTILQVTLLLIIFGYMLYYMKKNNLPIWSRILSALFISLTPTIAGYAISAIKDTPSAIFTLLYVILLLQIVRNYDSILKNKFRIIALMFLMLIIMMLRNNGIYTIIFSFPLLLLIYKNKWKKITLILTVCLSIFGLYDKVLLPALNVTDGSIKEVLTIPFMQLARVAHFNPTDFTEEDKKIISKVMDFDDIQEGYNPNLADPVKDKYNKYTTKEELKDYFKVWFKYLKKYPIVYIESLINSTYGYFFPEVGESYAYLAVDSRVGKGTYINIPALEKYASARKTSKKLNEVLAKIPFTALFNHVAFYDWYLIFSCYYIINTKKYKYLIPLTPLLSVLLVCLASPINGSFRYILPIVFSVPIIFTTTYFAWAESRNNKL